MRMTDYKTGNFPDERNFIADKWLKAPGGWDKTSEHEVWMGNLRSFEI